MINQVYERKMIQLHRKDDGKWYACPPDSSTELGPFDSLEDLKDALRKLIWPQGGKR